MKRYAVATDRKNLSLLNHFRVRNLKVSEERIKFLTDKKSLLEMEKLFPLEKIDLVQSKLNTFLKKHLITLIGTLLIIALLVVQSRSIRRIVFSDPDTYNPEVLAFLEDSFRRFGPFAFLEDDLSAINQELRSEFYHYEWIGLRRKGATLYVDIREIKNQPSLEEKTPGSLYAKEAGIVRRYHAERGVVCVQEEVYVEKGALLISGEITHYDNSIERVRAKGWVVAEVLKHYDFKILQEKEETVRTGKVERKIRFFLFNNPLNKPACSFKAWDVEEGEAKTIGFLKIQEVCFYETKNVRTVYSEEEALKHAKSEVVKEFRKNRVSKFEKIIYMKPVKIEFDGTYYQVRLVVKMDVNIAEFVPLSN